jgi:hypothetical protein
VFKKLIEPLKIPKNKLFTCLLIRTKNWNRSFKKIIHSKQRTLLLPREGVKTALPMILFILSGSRADGNQYTTLQRSMMDRVKITRNSEHYVYVIVLKFLL